MRDRDGGRVARAGDPAIWDRIPHHGQQCPVVRCGQGRNWKPTNGNQASGLISLDRGRYLPLSFFMSIIFWALYSKFETILFFGPCTLSFS